jgi:hypothetical protein
MSKFLALLMVCVFAVALAGCATGNGYYDPVRSAGAGALGAATTGAAVGSIIGAATGNPGTGAGIGAATGAIVGAVGGYLYALNRNSQLSSVPAAAQTYNFAPSRANMVQIDQVYASPGSVHRGQSVSLHMAYTIMTPGNAPASVTLYHEVRRGNKLIGQTFQTQVTNYNGSYSDQVAFSVPRKARRGKYTVVNRVVSSAGTAEKISHFTVM